MIRQAQTDQEIAGCFAVLRQLRPRLQEAGFIDAMRELMAEGYRLAYLLEDGEVACVAGYRVSRNLLMEKSLYVGELSTAEAARSRGCGARMMDWLRQAALAEGCVRIHLDSGVDRHRAHRFYLDRDMHISSYHFSEALPPAAP